MSEDVITALVAEKVEELSLTIREREEELKSAVKEYRLAFLEQRAEELAGMTVTGYGLDHRLAPIRALEAEIAELKAWRENWLELEKQYGVDPQFRERIDEGLHPTEE